MASCILCLDVGFRFTGAAIVRPEQGRLVAKPEVIDAGESVEGERHASVAERDTAICSFMAGELRYLISKWSPAVVFTEIPASGSQSSRSSRCMGMATGVVAAVESFFPTIPFLHHLPSLCTKAVLGRKVVPKVQRGVISKGKHKGKPRMVSDKKAMVAAKMRDFFEWEDGDFAASKWEHVYDAAAALIAAKDSYLIAYAGWPEELLRGYRP